MKALNSLYYSSVAIFALGFALKFFRAPFQTVIMIVGLALLLIAAISYFALKQRVKGLLSLSAFITGLFLVSTLKFWPATPFITLAGFMLIITIILSWKSVPVFIGRAVIPLVLLGIALGFKALPADQRYYILNIEYNRHADADYWAWDKYSWFLNLQGKKAEAIEANNKAYNIVMNSEDQPMIDLISQHKKKLATDEWTSFK